MTDLEVHSDQTAIPLPSGAVFTEEQIAAKGQAISENALTQFADGRLDRSAFLLRANPARRLVLRELRKEARKAAKSLPVRRDVLASGTCVYCGGFAEVVDHIHPVSRGGSGAPENLAPACKWCNDSKLDFTPTEWRDWLASKGLPWPPLSREGFIRRMAAQLAATSEPAEAGEE